MTLAVGLVAPTQRKVALGALIGALAALAAAPAHASAQEEGKSLRCGAIVKRDVRLSADLVDCPGNGLVVGRRNVTIDLNGHTIDGEFLGSGIGNGVDNSRGFDRVRVLDGKITNFKRGVVLKRAARNRLSGLTLSRNHHGMLLSASKGTVVKDGSVSDSGESIRVGEGIVVRRGSHGTQFVRMLLHGNEETGISVFDSDRVRVLASIVTANYAGGIEIFDSADSAVLDSTLNNAGVGVRAERTRNTLVRGNTIESGQTSGVVLRGSTVGRVEDNTILGAYGDGVGVSGDRNVLVANRIRVSYSNGIAVYVGEDNAVKDNEATGLEGGIFVAAGVIDAYVARNLTNGSADDGIEVRTPSAVITDNTANDNADYGIEAVPGARDGGGNRASGNGNPEQCAGVSCASP